MYSRVGTAIKSSYNALPWVYIRQKFAITGFAILFTLTPLLGKTYKYHRTVPVGVDFIRGGDYCGGISVNLEAGDFFEDLRVRSGADGPTFRKGSKNLEVFPAELTVRVWVTTGPCTGPPDARQRGQGTS